MLSDLSFPRNENFVSTSRNLLKNKNWIFSIVRYFTWKLECLEYFAKDYDNDMPDGDNDINDYDDDNHHDCDANNDDE